MAEHEPFEGAQAIPGAPKRGRWIVWLLCALAGCVLVGLVLGARRLADIEQRELEQESEPLTLEAARELSTATRLSARLLELPLRREQRATFELCALGDLRAPAFRDAFEVLILHAEKGELMLRVPLDKAHLEHAQGDARSSCLLLGSGLIEHTGTYRIEAVWPQQPPPPEASSVRLWARVQASPELARSDLTLVCALGLSVLLTLLLVLRAAPAERPATYDHSHSALVASIAAPVLGLALLYLAMQWPSSGGLHTLYKGAGLLALQLALPFALVAVTRSGKDRREVLGLTRLSRPALAALLVLASVPLLVAAARLSLRVVPSTEIAPIQHFIAWPSGMLSAALLGVLLPVGEEMFFRGYLFGAWLRYGRGVAAAASITAFGLMHLEQSFGNWGGLLAICLTGSVLTGLRLLTGSVCASAISHVAYNLTLSASTLAAAASQ
jgi:membrane protease YdiL (CAAX protease family)